VKKSPRGGTNPEAGRQIVQCGTVVDRAISVVARPDGDEAPRIVSLNRLVVVQRPVTEPGEPQVAASSKSER